jgi:predicted DNA-binding transcriptional regulator AlpA
MSHSFSALFESCGFRCVFEGGNIFSTAYSVAMEHTTADPLPAPTTDATDWQNDDYWTQSQTARYIKVHRVTLWRLSNNHGLPMPKKAGERRLLYASKDVKAWVLSGPNPPPDRST